MSSPLRFNTHFVDSPWRGEEWKKRHRQHRQRQRWGSEDNNGDGDDNDEGDENDDCDYDDEGDCPDVNPLRLEEEDERGGATPVAGGGGGGGGDNHETDYCFVDEEVSRLSV